jgi:5-methylcytosine-specific restriction endonuclease McrA
MYPKSHMLVRPRAYWFAVFSAERRAERARLEREARLSAIPQPIRYGALVHQKIALVRAPRTKLPPKSLSYRARLFEAQDGRCYLCLRHMAAPTEDHVVPKAMGGKNRANRLLACTICNGRKASRPPHPCERLFLWVINLRVVHRARPVERLQEAQEAPRVVWGHQWAEGPQEALPEALAASPCPDPSQPPGPGLWAPPLR